MLEAALFDLDGTLLDTAPDLTLAANALRVELGMAPMREDVITTFLGKGMENLVRRVLAGSLQIEEDAARDISRELDLFRHHYHRVNGDRTRIFDGTLDGLKAMRDAGIALAVVTNKPTEFTLPLLEQTGLRGFFPVVVCGDTCEHKKPHPQPVLHACDLLGKVPAQAVVIGDSVNDALAARAAGTAVLVVPYGYNEGREVSTLDVDGIVDSLPEAAEWIRQRNDPAAAVPGLA
ncbi:phosphoglycolate phosphatase [Verticiella sediminum]|uniref:Phosphoglycolate phosphatase n=1 Tax=Verticiella sediminum TaxID=1247510 RepID=A0A556AJ86_9BURK|nr:phosphoglycolate phosphatase [Verticiella sediminum]TSH92925.1 phosphoglycolate phosphatase [Verticiella sediminum]